MTGEKVEHVERKLPREWQEAVDRAVAAFKATLNSPTNHREAHDG